MAAISLWFQLDFAAGEFILVFLFLVLYQLRENLCMYAVQG